MSHIDLFRPEDIGDVLTLWRATPGVGLSSADEPDQLRLFLDRNPGTSFVAREDGRLVGAILGGWDGRRGYIHHLAVDTGRRRAGVGTALLESTLAEFRRMGVLKVHMFVFPGNTPAIEFYSRRGWQWREDIRVMSRSL